MTTPTPTHAEIEAIHARHVAAEDAVSTRYESRTEREEAGLTVQASLSDIPTLLAALDEAMVSRSKMMTEWNNSERELAKATLSADMARQLLNAAERIAAERQARERAAAIAATLRAEHWERRAKRAEADAAALRETLTTTAVYQSPWEEMAEILVIRTDARDAALASDAGAKLLARVTRLEASNAARLDVLLWARSEARGRLPDRFTAACDDDAGAKLLAEVERLRTIETAARALLADWGPHDVWYGLSSRALRAALEAK